MSDISLIWNPAIQSADWQLFGRLLESGDDLQSAIAISLFTDRVAGPDDVIPDGTGDPRGWLGDHESDYQIGSRLWLLSRAKALPETAQLAKEYCAEALQWLIDDGVIASFDIDVGFNAQRWLGIVITANRPDGSAQSHQYDWVWDQME